MPQADLKLAQQPRVLFANSLARASGLSGCSVSCREDSLFMEALNFTILACGFITHSALEAEDSADVHIVKIGNTADRPRQH